MGKNKCPSHNISRFQEASRPGLTVKEQPSCPCRKHVLALRTANGSLVIIKTCRTIRAAPIRLSYSYFRAFCRLFCSFVRTPINPPAFCHARGRPTLKNRPTSPDNSSPAGLSHVILPGWQPSQQKPMKQRFRNFWSLGHLLPRLLPTQSGTLFVNAPLQASDCETHFHSARKEDS